MLALQAAIVRFAIRFRGVVAGLACLLVLFGIYSFLDAKYDVFPEFSPPEVGIQTEAPGLSPEQVELLVTRPIEAQLNGLSDVSALRSTSIQGLSVVTLVFRPGTDIYRARQLVAERLATLGGQLPPDVSEPVMAPLTSSASTVLIIGLTSDKHSLMAVRSEADWTLRRRLLATDGVAKVTVFGGDQRSLQIQVRPDELVRLGLGFGEVLAAARRATGTRGAGFVETPNQRIVLQAEAPDATPDEIAKAVVTRRGDVPVTLGDVATVAYAPVPPIGGATIDGVPGVLIMVGAQYGSNTLEVTRRVETALADLRPSLAAAGYTLRTDLFRPADFIITATNAVELALLLGAVLVMVVLFLFLSDWRISVISCTAIPLSLLSAVLVLRWSGATLNTMTLGGLAIAIGEVVDDAVIDVENIARRLRENRRAEAPRSAARIILDASLEVRGAVVYATFAVVLAFVPVLALPGLAGRLFAPLAAAYALAVLASLVVALTVTPALSALLLVGARHGAAVEDPPLVRWSRRHYDGLIRRILPRPWRVSIAAAVLTAGAAALLPFFGGTFLPDLKEGHFIVHTLTAPGTALAESIRLGHLLSDALLKLPAVRSVAQHVGRAELADDTSGTHDSEFEVDLKPGLGGAAQETARDDIIRVANSFPGVSASINTFLTERVDETLSGTGAAVLIDVFGSDLDAIDRAAADIADVVDDIPGAEDVRVLSPPGLPQLSIKVSATAAAAHGLDPADVLDAVRAAYQGETVGTVYRDDRATEVLVILDPTVRAHPARIGALPLRGTDGRYARLDAVAQIDQVSGRYQVQHLRAERVAGVSLNVRGRDVASLVAAAKKRIAAKVKLPPGVSVEFAGAAEEEARARGNIIAYSVLSVAGIVLVLSVITRQRRNLLLVLANLPFALIGGVLAALVTGAVLSLGSIVGFVTLFGITLRNAIMMLSHYEHLVGVEGREWNAATAVEGALDRLVPILMTSLVTALGLAPLAFGMNEPGREIEGPMAAVILGGLASSMLLNLLVLPTLALRFGKFAPVRDEFEL